MLNARIALTLGALALTAVSTAGTAALLAGGQATHLLPRAGADRANAPTFSAPALVVPGAPGTWQPAADRRGPRAAAHTPALLPAAIPAPVLSPPLPAAAPVESAEAPTADPAAATPPSPPRTSVLHMVRAVERRLLGALLAVPRPELPEQARRHGPRHQDLRQGVRIDRPEPAHRPARQGDPRHTS